MYLVGIRPRITQLIFKYTPGAPLLLDNNNVVLIIEPGAPRGSFQSCPLQMLADPLAIGFPDPLIVGDMIVYLCKPDKDPLVHIEQMKKKLRAKDVRYKKNGEGDGRDVVVIDF